MFRTETIEGIGHCVVDADGAPISFNLETFERAVNEAERLNAVMGIDTPISLLDKAGK